MIYKEHHMQSKVAEYLDSMSAQGFLAWSHPPNEGRRSQRNGWHLKQQGMKSGEADCIICPVGGQAFYIELKRKGNGLSKNQEARKEELEHLGFSYHVVTALTPDEAVMYVQVIVNAELRGLNLDVRV